MCEYKCRSNCVCMICDVCGTAYLPNYVDSSYGLCSKCKEQEETEQMNTLFEIDQKEEQKYVQNMLVAYRTGAGKIIAALLIAEDYKKLTKKS